jgi:hypothetical protein
MSKQVYTRTKHLIKDEDGKVAFNGAEHITPVQKVMGARGINAAKRESRKLQASGIKIIASNKGA